MKNIFLKYFPAFVSGLLLTACFPRTGLSFLGFIALVPLFSSVMSMNFKEAFYAGLTAGFAHYLTLMYWLVPTLNTYGGIHPVLGVSVLALLCFYLGIYFAVFSFLLRKISSGFCLAAPLAASCLWVGLEYIRTHAMTGFPWGIIGYSQYSNLLMIQIADFSGVYGVSFIMVLSNYVVSILWVYLNQRHQPFFILTGKEVLFASLYTVVLISGTLIYGSIKMKIIETEIKGAQTTGISLIQGNIRQNLKWDDEFKEKIVKKYEALSEKVLETDPDLIVWPETALPFYYYHDDKLSARVNRSVRHAGTNFLIGSPAFENKGDNKISFFNRAYMLNRFSLVTGTYDKQHLIPFGEYVPFGRYLSFLGKIIAQAGDFSTGEKTARPLRFDNRRTGVLICFEILFPSIASHFVREGADILTLITNDAWFGFTSAAMQHFSVGVFRAVENRRSLASVANTGVSGFIDPGGKILQITPLFEDFYISQKLPVLSSVSFYTKNGDVFALGCIVAVCLVFVIKGFGKKIRRDDYEHRIKTEY